MADRESLERALVGAHKAGDEKAARALASALKNLPSEPEKSFMQSAKDFVTGDDRATELTESLPELGALDGSGNILGGEDKSKIAALTPAILSTLDPFGIAEIVSNNFENVGVAFNKDAEGNLFPILRNNKTGVAVQVNKPGISGIDVLQGLGLAAVFTPAGRAGLGSGVVAGSAKVGAASGATQAGLNALQQASGREATGKEIAGEVGFAALGGFVFENLFRAMGAGWRGVANKLKKGEVDDQARNAFKEQAQRFGIPAEEITDDYIKRAANDALDAFDGDLTALEREFKVGLTNAQRSGSQSALSQEDSLRSGIRGQAAQDAFLKGEANQNQQILQASGRLQDDIARGAESISTRQQAGAALRDGVQRLEVAANDAIEAAYANVGDASLSPEGFKGLLRATKNATRSIEFPKSDKLVPAYAELRRSIRKAEVDLLRLSKQPGMRLKPMHIRSIETVRKSLNSYMDAAANPTDRRNILATRQAFDNYLDDAVIKGLFDGDQEALTALKSSREVFKDYMKKFSPRTDKTRLGKSKDQPGEFISKIILDNPTDEQVINSLFTVGGFNKPGAAKMAQRYKELLGADSTEWNMVRQAAFKQLVKTNNVNGAEVISGAKTLTAIQKALESNKSLVSELFSGEEVLKLKRFANLVKRAQPDLVKSRENPSGTAQKAMKEIGNLAQRFLPFVDGGAVSFTGGVGVVMKNRAATKAAEQAFRPFSKLQRSVGESVAEGAAIGQSEKLEPLTGT